MKKRTSNLSRRIVSLLMSLVLTLTLVTPAAFATEVVDGSGTPIVEGGAGTTGTTPSGDAGNGGSGDVSTPADDRDTEDKNTEDGKDEQPTNPGDEDKNPGEGEGDANKPAEDNKGEENPAEDKKDEVNKDEQPTEDENNSEDDIAPLNDDTDSDVWGGKPAEKFAGGAGTVDDPYKISTGAELAYLAEKVNGGESYSGNYFKLTSDIRLNTDDVPTSGNEWTPIGNGTAKPFSGIFDGAGHVISGLYISDAAFPGLFGKVSGTVQNLVVQGSVTGGDEAIGESEAAGGICSTSEGEIQNCGFYGKVSDSTDMLFIGGVAGIGNATNCWYYSLNDKDTMWLQTVCNGTATNCYHNIPDKDVTVDNYISTDFPSRVAEGLNGYAFEKGWMLWKAAAEYPVINPELAYDVQVKLQSAVTNSRVSGEVGFGDNLKQSALTSYSGSIMLKRAGHYTGDIYYTTVAPDKRGDNAETYLTKIPAEGVDYTPTKPDEGTTAERIITLYYGTWDEFNNDPEVSGWYYDHSGSGYYSIENAKQLAFLAVLVNTYGVDFSGKTVQLSKDIDISEVADWTPIGDTDHPFKGTFNGGVFVGSGYNQTLTPYTISGLNGDLFGVVDGGTIQYVTINGGTGRLVNELKSGKVQYCMSTAEVTESAGGGMVGTVVSGATVSSSYYYNEKCKDTPAVGSGIATNCFYLAETSTFDKKGTADDTGARTAEEFASGQVAWEFNDAKNGESNWEQDMAAGQLPKLGRTNRVYKVELKTQYASDELKKVTVTAVCGDKRGNVLYVNAGAEIAFEVNKNGFDRNLSVMFSQALTNGIYTLSILHVEGSAVTITCDVSEDTVDYSWYYDKDEQEYKSSPYEIKTEAQLLAFAALVNGTASLSSITGENTVATRSDNFSGKTVQLADNIELSAAAAWTPVGDASGKAFSGTFDGKGHTIRGLTDPLFGYVQNGTLQNVTLENVSINKTDKAAAGLVCYLQEQSIIRNCTVSGKVEVTRNSASGIVYLAGAGSKIESCVNKATITITNGSNTSYAGGIVANFGGSELKLCQNSGTIAGPVAGGIIGYRSTKGGDIRNCLNANGAAVNGTAYAGGIIGQIYVIGIGSDQSFAVDNCRNEAAVTVSGTNAYAGGVIGFANTTSWQSAKVTAVNLANIGAVTAESGTAGGVIGGKHQKVVLVLHNSYNHGAVTGSQAYGLSGAGDITNSYYVCRVNAEDKVSYVDKNSIEQSVSTTNYKVGETDETLVDTLNANRGTALAWFVNPKQGVAWPIFVIQWNGDKDGRSPLAAIKVTYNANGGEGEYVDVVYTQVGTDNKPTALTYTVLGIEDTGITSDNGPFATWNENPSGGESGTSHAPGSTMELTGDITLYAQWNKIWEGKGTEDSPYLIPNADKFKALQAQVNDKGFNYKGKYFALTPENKTIALTGKWTPIGNGNTSFGGSIEGNGTTITGLQVSEEWYAGLFRLLGVDGTSTYIRNLTISGDVTAEKGHAGGLTAIVGNGTITLENITTEVTVTSHGDKKDLPFGSAGGLIGYNVANDGAAYNVVKVIKCINKGSIYGATAGGIAGANNNPNAASQYTLEDCTNEGSVTGLLYAGGILGGSTNSAATRCENSGTVKATETTGTRGYAGGICATNLRWAERCVNTGAVSGQYAGGIAYGLSSTYGGEAKYCLNKGNITGTRIAAGIVVYGKKADIGGIGGIFFSYNLGEIKGSTDAYSYGIAQGGTIKNCFTYNEAKHVAISANNKLVTNSYYLADSAGDFPATYGGEWASKDDFASGKVAWGVGGKGEGSQGGTGQDAKLGWWKQDKNDAYPTLLDNPDMSKRYYRTDVDCGTGGEVELARNASSTVKELSSKEAVYGPAGTSVTIKATPMDNTYALKSMTVQLPVGTAAKSISNPATFTMPNEGNVLVTATFGSATPSGGGGYYYGGSGDGTGTGDKDDEGLQDGLNMDVEYDIKGLVLGAYAEWGSNGGNKSFQKWLEENPNVVRALLTNSLDNMATAAVGKKTDEAKDLAALLLASLNEHTGVDGKNGDTIAKALQKYIDSGSEEVFSAWLTGGGGMASGTYESIYGQYASSLAALADRLYSKWEASGTSMTFPVWLDSQQVSMDSLSENADEPDTDNTNDPQTSDAPDDVPDGQDTEGGASGNSVWEIIGTVVRENPILVWSIVAVIAALIIVGAVRRYHKVKRDEHDEK